MKLVRRKFRDPRGRPFFSEGDASLCDAVEKFGEWNFEGSGDTRSAENCRISNAAFDAADVGAIEVRLFGKGFLRKPQGLAPEPNIFTESGECRVSDWHPHTSSECGVSIHGL